MFKSMVLAALAVIGIGSAAEAATVAPIGSYSVEITMSDIKVYCFIMCEPLSNPVDYGGMNVGDVVNATLNIGAAAGHNDIVVDLRWDGGILADNVTLSKIFENIYYNTLLFQLSFSVNDGLLRGVFNGTKTVREGNIGGSYEFESIVPFTQIAPVPLPASAALLPLGLGALAMMRKRRRQVS